MAERSGDPGALGRVAANRAVLARLVDGAQRSCALTRDFVPADA